MGTGTLDKLGRRGPGIITNVWHFLGLSFWYFLIRVFNQVSIIGKENIPRRGEKGVLILYNHISAIDPFTVGVTSMPFFSSVWWRAPAKEELFRYPMIRNILYSWGAFPVRRGKQDFESIQLMARHLKDGILVIAPEGRRSKDGNLLPGRPGVGRVIYLGKPRKVIPVALQGTDRVLPPGKIIPRIYQRIKVCYGTPVQFGSLLEEPDSKEVSQKIADEVMKNIAALKLKIAS